MPLVALAPHSRRRCTRGRGEHSTSRHTRARGYACTWRRTTPPATTPHRGAPARPSRSPSRTTRVDFSNKQSKLIKLRSKQLRRTRMFVVDVPPSARVNTGGDPNCYFDGPYYSDTCPPAAIVVRVASGKPRIEGVSTLADTGV